jgi:S-(hydroxymethyl)glutathione dehydrogenase/alcohol dehydrogenase
MKIRAAVLEEFATPLVVQEVDLDGPGAGEVLVRLAACGVCHTDMYTAGGADPSGYAPAVLGHEGAGVVEAVGEGVTWWRRATTSSLCSRPSAASAGTAGRTRPTSAWRSASSRTSATCPTRPRGGTAATSASATSWARARSPRQRSCPRSRCQDRPEAPLDVVCSLACGATTGIGAALYVAKVEPGSTVAVFGAGLVGLGAVAGARLAGAERIICVDLDEGRLEAARHHGATDTFVGGPDAVQRIVDMTGGFGADYTFEATGNVGVMRQAVEAARMGWGCARSPAWPARARCSRWSRGS